MHLASVYQTCSLLMLLRTLWFLEDPLYRSSLQASRMSKRIAFHTVTKYFNKQILRLVASMTQLSLSFLLMSASTLYNNLDLKKHMLQETCYLFVEHGKNLLEWHGCTFDSDWTPKCLHFHLLIHCLVASLWLSVLMWLKGRLPPCFLDFFCYHRLKRKCSINSYVLTFHADSFAQVFHS